VSNRRKISLPHLADVLASGLAVDPRLKPAPVRARPAFPRVTTGRVEELLDRDLIRRCQAAFYASDHRERGTGVRWVMDLSYYKRLRASSGDKTDEELWAPNDADVFFGIPVQVRAGGGQPHLEPTEDTAAGQLRYRAMLDSQGALSIHYQGRPQ
jgi:hypothetical protein